MNDTCRSWIVAFGLVSLILAGATRPSRAKGQRGQSRRGRARLHCHARFDRASARDRSEHGLVEREHDRQGRGLCRQGRGPEPLRRGPGGPRAALPSSRRCTKPSSTDATLARGRSTCSIACTWKSRSIPSCSSGSRRRPTTSRRRSTSIRAKVDGKEMADSEVRKILKESKDSNERQAVWEASKGVGKAVEADLKAAGQSAQRSGHASWASRTTTPCSST